MTLTNTYSLTEYEKKVFRWLENAEEGLYPIKKLTKEPVRFIETVKKYIDNSNGDVYFSEDYKSIRKIEPWE